ncbi:MAG TPA: 3-hydroxyacyl-CoA dehydrogenase NAD-binding domain-containing protein, partial [Saprospiraceae bacterium]|nr:3-hydroxyacyl-CoA dehydrogenase NAD-binding domain-containing protein [Saprospiraceae bacterium]
MNCIAVIGAGAMGSGIGQVAAMAGNEVYIYDTFSPSIIKAQETISFSLNKLFEKNKITGEQSKDIFRKIHFIDKLHEISNCDLIIEAIIENEAEKKKLFQQIEAIVDKNAIIASNTSSLSVTRLAHSLSAPERFIGIHFFNPPFLMKLVEIIPALQTSPEITEKTIEIIRSWDKTTVVAKDTPGFIVNRIARPFYGEALRIAEEQLATPELIDRAMKEIGGFKMGPFELMDFIGNDINQAVTHSVWSAMNYDQRYKPSFLQQSMVAAGWLGKKAGKGFYNYTSGGEKINSDSGAINQYIFTITKEDISERIVTMLINEAADAHYYGIASRDDIDKAMSLGVNYPKGLLKWADEMGIQTCVDRMDHLYEFYREDRYRCSPGLRKMASA